MGSWLPKLTDFFRPVGGSVLPPKGIPTRSRTKLTPPTAPVERDRVPAPIIRPRSRRSDDNGNLAMLKNPWNRIQPTQNFGLYAAIRETIPIVDAAIVKKRQILGCPLIDAKPETRREVMAWLESLHVHGLQRGWGNWLATFADNALHYGRAHTEIIRTNDRTDVWGLQQIHPKTITLRPSEDRVSVEIVQSQPFAGEPILLPSLLMLNWMHEIHGDDPNGTSLLWGLPFVAEIMQKLFKNLGSTWDRFGTPRYHINWDPPDDWDDPDGTQSDEILADLSAQFNQSLESGVQGDIVDFYTSGKVTVSIIGAEGETLALEMPMRAVEEQIVTKTHIPPSAFGLHWASGEQLTQFQANLLTVDTNALRAEVTPEIAYLIDYRQRLTGGDRNIRLIWPEPTLIDIFNQSRADFFRQNAIQLQQRNLQNDWRLGLIDEYDYVRKMRPELAHLTDEEIDARLPDLAHEPPDEATPSDNGDGRTGTGGGGGLGPGSSTGNSLNDMLYYQREALTNGNGKKH